MFSAEINLPLSKSESNRALMLQAWSAGKIRCGQVSDAADTRILQKLLSAENAAFYDARDAGTSLRFLAAWLALTGKHTILTGTPRMMERPVGKLVSALRELGCVVFYDKQEGFPPLRFAGFSWSGKSRLEMKDVESSQFISALMMAAPSLPEGLHFHLAENTASFPYLELTAGMMQQCGLVVDISRSKIVIPYQDWPGASLSPAADWSAASYFYGMLAVLPAGSSFSFPGLQINSRQSDRMMAELGSFWHIETCAMEGGVRIMRKKEGTVGQVFSFDFSDCPDLALSLICTCAASGIAGEFSGLSSLRIKESDRLKAMQTELQKIGIELQVSQNGEKASLLANEISWPSQPPVFQTHKDHRIAMALAIMVVALRQKAVFANPEVVEKSFPGFWREVEKLSPGIKFA